MEGGVGAHKGIPPLPVEDPLQDLTEGGQALTGEGVPHGFALLADGAHGPGAQMAQVMGLTPSAGIKRRTVEGHAASFGVHGQDNGLEATAIGVGLVKKFGRRHHHGFGYASHGT
jgi:hypothetical protein